MKKWNAPAIEELELDMTASGGVAAKHECRDDNHNGWCDGNLHPAWFAQTPSSGLN